MTSRTVYYVAQSLDGFIADREGSLDWLLDFGFDDFQQQYDDFLAGVGAIVMGAGTYRWLAEHSEPWAYTKTPTWVVTHGDLPAIDGAVFQRSDDAEAALQEARAVAGELDTWVVGGGVMAATLVDARLIDRLQVTTMPVTLGAGTPVLPHAAASIPWHLESVRAQGSGGAVESIYRARSS